MQVSSKLIARSKAEIALKMFGLVLLKPQAPRNPSD